MTEKARLTRAQGAKQVVDDSVHKRVDDGHIVPATYQRNFARGHQVLLHEIGSEAEPELRNVKSVCTRGPYYRRERPDGTLVDDIERSLAHVEDKAGWLFKRIRETGSVEQSDKGLLANFFALQWMRSPTFFAARDAVVGCGVDAAPDDQFKAEAVSELGIEAARLLATQLLTSSTAQTFSMLGLSTKAAAVLANMHWTLVQFDDPVLVYSDHPVVVWPVEVPVANSFRGQQLPLMDAIEIRIPLTSTIALLLTWQDGPDFKTLRMSRAWAGELNQLTIGQADEEWAHMPDTRPPVAPAGHEPLAPRLWPGYTPGTMHQTKRQRHVRNLLHRHRHRDRIKDFDMVSFVDPPNLVTYQPPNPRPKPRKSKHR